MTRSTRRLTIFALIMVIFALLFAELVERASRDTRRAYLGTSITCLNPAAPTCTYAL